MIIQTIIYTFKKRNFVPRVLPPIKKYQKYYSRYDLGNKVHFIFDVSKEVDCIVETLDVAGC